MRNVPLVSLVTLMNGILLRRGLEAILFLNVIYILSISSHIHIADYQFPPSQVLVVHTKITKIDKKTGSCAMLSHSQTSNIPYTYTILFPFILYQHVLGYLIYQHVLGYLIHVCNKAPWELLADVMHETSLMIHNLQFYLVYYFFYRLNNVARIMWHIHYLQFFEYSDIFRPMTINENGQSNLITQII